MRMFSALAVLISVLAAGEAASGELVPLDAFLDMVASNNDREDRDARPGGSLNGQGFGGS